MKVVATLLMGLALTGCTSNSSVTPSQANSTAFPGHAPKTSLGLLTASS